MSVHIPDAGPPIYLPGNAILGELLASLVICSDNRYALLFPLNSRLVVHALLSVCIALGLEGIAPRTPVSGSVWLVVGTLVFVDHPNISSYSMMTVLIAIRGTV